jgi:hypothetical protein
VDPSSALDPVLVSAARASRIDWGVVVILAFAFLAPVQLVLRFSEISSEGRLEVGKDTLHLIAAYPVFGRVGPPAVPEGGHHPIPGSPSAHHETFPPATDPIGRNPNPFHSLGQGDFPMGCPGF